MKKIWVSVLVVILVVGFKFLIKYITTERPFHKGAGELSSLASNLDPEMKASVEQIIAFYERLNAVSRAVSDESDCAAFGVELEKLRDEQLDGMHKAMKVVTECSNDSRCKNSDASAYYEVMQRVKSESIESRQAFETCAEDSKVLASLLSISNIYKPLAETIPEWKGTPVTIAMPAPGEASDFKAALDYIIAFDTGLDKIAAECADDCDRMGASFKKHLDDYGEHYVAAVVAFYHLYRNTDEAEKYEAETNRLEAIEEESAFTQPLQKCLEAGKFKNSDMASFLIQFNEVKMRLAQAYEKETAEQAAENEKEIAEVVEANAPLIEENFAYLDAFFAAMDEIAAAAGNDCDQLADGLTGHIEANRDSFAQAYWVYYFINKDATSAAPHKADLERLEKLMEGKSPAFEAIDRCEHNLKAQKFKIAFPELKRELRREILNELGRLDEDNGE